MTKSDLVGKVSEDCDLSAAEAKRVVESVFENVGDALINGDMFRYHGFGTFKVRSRKARMGRNPHTGAALQIAASKSVGFKVAPKLKEKL
ncbi:DNA-binding protein HU [Candidatus Pacearchaeota archaeon]|nr:DNA-binding protein HU [Candidatus Pacearchaeota archaeon]